MIFRSHARSCEIDTKSKEQKGGPTTMTLKHKVARNYMKYREMKRVSKTATSKLSSANKVTRSIEIEIDEL